MKWYYKQFDLPEWKIKQWRRPNIPTRCGLIATEVGIGGGRCICCAPPPGHKARRSLLKRARRLDKIKALNEELETLRLEKEEQDNEL